MAMHPSAVAANGVFVQTGGAEGKRLMYWQPLHYYMKQV